ncbi:MAG: hypothetical protein Q4E13_09660 [Clostridia bacterium]|nr:hypothetical protein [Clostridia bacterium]
MLESFAVAAFQEDEQLADCTDINGDPSCVNLICEICDGESIEDRADESDVRFVIYTPIADAEALAEKVFDISK